MHRSSGSRYGGGRSGGYGDRRSGGGRHGGGRRGGGRGGNKSEFGIRRDQIGGKLQPVNWEYVGMEAYTKLSYQPKVIGNPQQVQHWRQANEIFTQGDDLPDPIEQFQDAPFPDAFQQKFRQLGFSAPTPIQSQAWPMVLSGRDVIGIAETGSGKTLAFVIPGIIHLQQQVPSWGRHGPTCLVVAPTRELAIQIESETKKFCESMGVKVGCCYGGAPRRKQEYMIRNGVEFLIATPGRLLDFLERGTIRLHKCSYVVFDEADRMLDMGFEPQIRALMSQVRPDRQMLMFSATWPREVQNLAHDFLPNKRMLIKVGDEQKAAENVTQIIEVISRYEKENKLRQILQTHSRDKIIMFTSTKRMADRLSQDLQRQGYQVDSIHGDKEQWRREQILASFKRSQITVLVATDVAARGLDVKDLTLVINYDFPQNCDDYIHRVGRTGRAGAQGTAITFFDPKEDGKHARKLVTLLEKSSQNVPDALRNACRGGYGGGRGGGRRYGGGRGGGRNSRFGGGRSSGHRSSYRPY